MIPGLHLSKEDEAAVANGLNRNLQTYARLRDLPITADIDPAIVFKPNLPGQEPKGPATPGAKLWQAEDGLHVDVRGLHCPEPLVTVLRLIDGGKVEAKLFAHLGQEPLLLYPELDARGCSYRLLPAAEEADEVLLEIRHSAR